MLTIEQQLDKTIREEFGGCNPNVDNPCKLKVRIKDKIIEVFCVGKWRGIRYYGILNKRPSNDVMERVEWVVRLDSGDTFEGRKIEWVWVD